MPGEHDAKIEISGHGQLNADVIAVGYQAHASKVVNAAADELAKKGLANVRAQLEAVMTLLKQHESQLADPQPAFELTERVAHELTQPKPDKLTLKGFLTLLAEETKSVAEIATAALSLKGLVSGLF